MLLAYLYLVISNEAHYIGIIAISCENVMIQWKLSLKVSDVGCLINVRICFHRRRSRFFSTK